MLNFAHLVDKNFISVIRHKIMGEINLLDLI